MLKRREEDKTVVIKGKRKSIRIWGPRYNTNTHTIHTIRTLLHTTIGKIFRLAVSSFTAHHQWCGIVLFLFAIITAHTALLIKYIQLLFYCRLQWSLVQLSLISYINNRVYKLNDREIKVTNGCIYFVRLQQPSAITAANFIYRCFLHKSQ